MILLSKKNFLHSISLPAAVFLLFLILLSSNYKLQAQEEDEEIITVDSSVVILNAIITDKNGRPAYGLNEKQFEVYEDGKKQEIAFFLAQETPFSAVILMDTSGSMEARVSLARSSAIKFLDGIRLSDNVAIYNFDSEFSLVQDFSNLRDLVHKAFDLKADGYTVLNDAIYEAAKLLENRPEKRRAIIVLSDGADTRSKRSHNKALQAALKANAMIYTVDMSEVFTGGRARMQNQGALKKFAEKSGGIFVKTPGGIEMREAFENIVEELGVQYTIGYYPSNTKKDGKWREIELKIADKDLNVRTREGYQAEKN